MRRFGAQRRRVHVRNDCLIAMAQSCNIALRDSISLLEARRTPMVMAAMKAARDRCEQIHTYFASEKIAEEKPTMVALSKGTTLLPPFACDSQLLTYQQAIGTNKSTMTPSTKKKASERLRETLHEADLQAMHSWLWYAGRKGNISPLHHQTVLRREVVLTETARLHLVWCPKIIYFQRLSNELLSRDYFAEMICDDRETYEAATGFLLTYARLIEYPSDLAIARRAGLVNDILSWDSWQKFRTDVLHTLAVRKVHDRYEYGELRLGRLNSIYRLKGFGLTYFNVYRDYLSYFGENYTGLVALFALVSVALSAMQVMMGIEGIPAVVMAISYRFAIATLFALAVSCALLLVFFVGFCAWNWSLIYSRHQSSRT